jgi:8-oxo-dGTP pyrophosphatase MutT (NUDIX family)
MSAFKKFLYRVYRLRWVVTRPVTLGVRLLLIKDGQVVLVKPSYQDGWYFPGGGVKRNETLEQAARREAKEEVGADLGKLDLFGIYDLFYESKNDHIVLFQCADFTYTGKFDFEIERVQAFPLHALPADLASGHERRIKEYLEGREELRFGYW